MIKSNTGLMIDLSTSSILKRKYDETNKNDIEQQEIESTRKTKTKSTSRGF
jgi:hypothetical protein